MRFIINLLNAMINFGTPEMVEQEVKTTESLAFMADSTIGEFKPFWGSDRRIWMGRKIVTPQGPGTIVGVRQSTGDSCVFETDNGNLVAYDRDVVYMQVA